MPLLCNVHNVVLLQWHNYDQGITVSNSLSVTVFPTLSSNQRVVQVDYLNKYKSWCLVLIYTYMQQTMYSILYTIVVAGNV